MSDRQSWLASQCTTRRPFKRRGYSRVIFAFRQSSARQVTVCRRRTADRHCGGYPAKRNRDSIILISLRSWKRLGGQRSFQHGSDDAAARGPIARVHKGAYGLWILRQYSKAVATCTRYAVLWWSGMPAVRPVVPVGVRCSYCRREPNISLTAVLQPYR